MILFCAVKAGEGCVHRIKRLAKTRDYRHIYSAGSLYSTPLVKVYILPTHNAFTRLGVVVSRRVNTRATCRNKIRRVLKHWFKAYAPEALCSRHDIVIVVRKPADATRQTNTLLIKDLESLLNQ